MKKIAILINAMGGGGAERVVSILLKDLVNRYEVFLVMLHSGIVYEIPKEVNLHYLSHSTVNISDFSKTIYLPFLGYKYYLFCKKNKIDISLSLLNRANYINIFSKCFGAKHRTVISERSVAIEEYAIKRESYEHLSLQRANDFNKELVFAQYFSVLNNVKDSI